MDIHKYIIPINTPYKIDVVNEFVVGYKSIQPYD